MSITVVSAPSTPTPPTATGSDVSAAGHDFAKLLQGQLTSALPIAAEQADLPITDAALPPPAPIDAASLLAALELGTKPTEAKTSDAAPSDETPAEATPTDAAAMLTALGLATTPAIAAAPNLVKTEQPAGEPATTVSGSAAQSPSSKALGESLNLNTTAVPSPAPSIDDQAANFAATLATAKESGGAKVDSATTSDNISSLTSNVASHTINHAVHRESSLAVHTPVRDQNWATDLGQKVVWLANADKQSAQLTLTPPEMGPIEISLDVDKGTASVSFTSANAEVRDALETALPKLREMFASAGIELGQTNVGAQSFSQQQAGNSAQNQRSSRGQGDNGILAAETIAPLQTAALAAQRGNGMVDLFA